MKHSRNIKTKSYFINSSGCISPSFIFYQMQDIAWEHSNILGFGYRQLQEKNQIWALSRILIKIERLPRWNEKFSLETWLRGNDKFFGFRDFNFIDNTGKSIVKATSSWIVIDQNLKRIVKLSDISGYPFNSVRILEQNAEKVRSPNNNLDHVFTPVLYSEIDINQHFNTGKFIERITDSYDYHFHEDHELIELEMNFLKEGKPEDKLAVNKQYLDASSHLCSIVREDDGVDLVRARMIWRKKRQ